MSVSGRNRTGGVRKEDMPGDGLPTPGSGVMVSHPHEHDHRVRLDRLELGSGVNARNARASVSEVGTPVDQKESGAPIGRVRKEVVEWAGEKRV